MLTSFCPGLLEGAALGTRRVWPGDPWRPSWPILGAWRGCPETPVAEMAGRVFRNGDLALPLYQAKPALDREPVIRPIPAAADCGRGRFDVARRKLLRHNEPLVCQTRG